MQNREETAEINGEEKIKVRGHKAGHICFMMLLVLPCVYLLLATSLLTLSSHHRRRLVFAYAVSPIPVSNPCHSFISCLHLFISFSEQFLRKALPPRPFFACSLKLSKASVAFLVAANGSVLAELRCSLAASQRKLPPAGHQ